MRGRQRTGRLLLWLAGVLVLLGVVGLVAGIRFVWAERLIDHVFVLGTLAAVLAAVGLMLATRSRWVGALAGSACLLVAVGWAGLGVVVTSFASGGDQDVTVPAPDGAGQRFEVVVKSGTSVIDPIWLVYVRQTRFPLARQWKVGCVNGDDPDDEFAGVQWRNRSTLVVTTVTGSGTVQVNPISGRPHRGRGGIWDSGC